MTRNSLRIKESDSPEEAKRKMKMLEFASEMGIDFDYTRSSGKKRMKKRRGSFHNNVNEYSAGAIIDKTIKRKDIEAW